MIWSEPQSVVAFLATEQMNFCAGARHIKLLTDQNKIAVNSL